MAINIKTIALRSRKVDFERDNNLKICFFVFESSNHRLFLFLAVIQRLLKTRKVFHLTKNIKSATTKLGLVHACSL